MTKGYKQSYEKKYAADLIGWAYEKLDLLPECKRVTKLGVTYEYQKARKKLLGFIPYTTWVDKNYIVWYPKDSVEYYTCSCEEKDDNNS